jgi:hypothetical protein
MSKYFFIPKPMTRNLAEKIAINLKKEFKNIDIFIIEGYVSKDIHEPQRYTIYR